jgi:hypothetical protein
MERSYLPRQTTWPEDVQPGDEVEFLGRRTVFSATGVRAEHPNGWVPSLQLVLTGWMTVPCDGGVPIRRPRRLNIVAGDR